MILKLEDIILEDLSKVMKRMLKKTLFEEEGISEYKPTTVTDHTEILASLIPYFDFQNMTFSMFESYIEKDDITRVEQFMVFDIFRILYPEEFYTLVFNGGQMGEEDVQELKTEIQNLSSQLFDNLSRTEDLKEYEKEFLITQIVVNTIKNITPGQKDLNIKLKDYFFENIIVKLFPHREEYKPATKEYFKYNFEDDSQPTTIINKGGNVSGWVIYIFGQSTDNSEEIINDIDDVVKNNNATLIATTNKYYQSGGIQKNNVGAIIYIPYEIITKGTQKNFLDEIVSALETYDPIGDIKGAKKYSNNVYYAYEFKTSFNNLPENGVPYENIGNYLSTDESDFVSGVLQPDLLSQKGELFQYYSSVITNITALKTFLRQEYMKIDWLKMGYKSNDYKTNLYDLEDRIDKSVSKNIFLSIPKVGFESFGINNFRDFVKKIS